MTFQANDTVILTRPNPKDWPTTFYINGMVADSITVTSQGATSTQPYNSFLGILSNFKKQGFDLYLSRPKS